MVDMTMLQGAVMSLKTAGDLAKGFLHLKSLADVQSKVIDLNEAILSAQASALAAQSEQFSMIQRVHDLEKELANLKAWEEEKKRYQLVCPWDSGPAMVYALKESCKGTEPPHWICTKCYDDGRRTILQPKHEEKGVVLVCPTCKSQTQSGYHGIGPATYA